MMAFLFKLLDLNYLNTNITYKRDPWLDNDPYLERKVSGGFR